MTGIADMFSELSGYPEYQIALDVWAAWRRHKYEHRDRSQERLRRRERAYEKTPIGRIVRREINARYRAKHRAEAVERTRRWRLANPERARKHNIESERRRRARAKIDPVFGAKYRAIIAASRERSRARSAS